MGEAPSAGAAAGAGMTVQSRVCAASTKPHPESTTSTTGEGPHAVTAAAAAMPVVSTTKRTRDMATQCLIPSLQKRITDTVGCLAE